MSRNNSGNSTATRLLAMAIIGGCCSCNHESPNVPDEGFDAGHSLSKSLVYPLSGKVLVNNRPPQGEGTIFVMLFRADAKDENRTNAHYTICDAQGRFEFSSYAKGDGMRPGKYIAVIAKLLKSPGSSYFGPDQFGNRFNDPEVNKSRPEFVIDHRAPGSRSYLLDLNTKTVPAPMHAGQKSLTEIERRF